MSNFDDATLVPIQRILYALRAMLDSNPQLFSSGHGEPIGRQNAEQDPWKIEQASAQQLRDLLGRTIEAISLLLIDYRISDLAEQCEVWQVVVCERMIGRRHTWSCIVPSAVAATRAL